MQCKSFGSAHCLLAFQYIHTIYSLSLSLPCSKLLKPYLRIRKSRGKYFCFLEVPVTDKGDDLLSAPNFHLWQCDLMLNNHQSFSSRIVYSLQKTYFMVPKRIPSVIWKCYNHQKTHTIGKKVMILAKRQNQYTVYERDLSFSGSSHSKFHPNIWKLEIQDVANQRNQSLLPQDAKCIAFKALEHLRSFYGKFLSEVFKRVSKNNWAKKFFLEKYVMHNMSGG